MVELYGRSNSRRDVCAHAGMLSQFAGVRLVELTDGVERGVRMLSSQPRARFFHGAACNETGHKHDPER